MVIVTEQVEAGFEGFKGATGRTLERFGPIPVSAFYPQLYLELLLCGQESSFAPDRAERGAL